MRSARRLRPHAPLLVLALLLAPLQGLCVAQAAPPDKLVTQPDLLLEVRLGPHLLSDAIGAFQQGDEVLLPLGEIARLLTIAIRANPSEGHASGFILDESRGFQLDLREQVVTQGSQRQPYAQDLVQRHADDIYVAASLLARWLPVDFAIDMASLSLAVRPRETLPLQARLERRGKAGVAQAALAPGDRGYLRHQHPYRLASMPFIDQTVGVDLRGSDAKDTRSASYTAYLTGDLMGTEAALYINSAAHVQGPMARLTLGRHDPDGLLLGSLKARTVQVGSVAGAAVPGIALGSRMGNGMLVSNRALGLPAHFDRHKLQGDLPPGWDVELYFNETLVGIEQSRPDGRYSFVDQPLIYGLNVFRLVFHGPLGQVRIERHTFLLEQSMLAAGQFDYSVSTQRDDRGHQRSAALFDWGLGRRLTASASLLRMPVHETQRSYASVGFQAYLENLIVNATAARTDDGGSLLQLGAKTRVRGLALAASRAFARDFVSDFYLPGADPLRRRDELRADGMLGPLPVTLQARRDRLASGRDNVELNARLSAYRHGTALSHALRWQSLGGEKYADGQLQASRRVGGIGVSGQLQYRIAPRAELSALALSADRHMAGGYLVGGSVTRTFTQSDYRFNASLNKSLGRFGAGLNIWATNRGEYGAGLQLFMALGQDRRSGRWLMDAVPMAASGSASPRVFLDKNRNGVMDGEDSPIAGVGFVVNGATHMARTGSDGVAWLGRLLPSQHADIALDAATLEDPQWHAAVAGVRIVPRAGSVAALDFAVGIKGDIDGTTWLLEHGAKRAAGDFELELVNAAQAVVARTTSSADGYFVMAAVAPGAYQLRIAPAQLSRLALSAPARAVQVDDQGNLVSGQDFVVTHTASSQSSWRLPIW